jgi:alkylation response protein AidB-like acyl-CoA dehydrogenase
LVAPIIYTFGSEEQKQTHLPGIRNAETWWGQCFSEPNAGSDLASLKTSAEFNGSHYIVNGHKTWTTLGQFADWLFLLAVIDKTVKPQQGISFFLVKADSPGITMRPIHSIEKGHTLNEFFFEDVAVPLRGLIGEVGKGCSYAKFLLENERAWSAEIPRNKALLNKLKVIAAESIDGAQPLLASAAFREKICELSARLNALEYMTLRAMSEQHEVAGEPLSAWEAGSILHIKGSEMQQEIGALMMEALGSYGAVYFPRYLATRAEHYPAGPDIAHGVAADYLYRRATTIYGGSNEIQRNIIAGAMLGKF